MQKIVSFIESALPQYLADLEALVNVDCGTFTKRGVDWVGEWVNARGFEWGWDMQYFPQHEFGNCYLARLHGHESHHDDSLGRLIMLGHMDTVYPEGTATERPLRREGQRLIGPGVCDMKSGLLTGMYALRALQVTGFDHFQELSFFFNSDEELGSPASKKLYMPFIQRTDAALVLESGRTNGNIVSARKGSGEYTVRVKGRAAHAGVEPEKGANAVLELAHQIIALHALNGIAPGVTVSATIIGGGTRTNVVPDEAWAQCDVRAVDPEGARIIQEALARLGEHTSVVGTSVHVEGRFGYPPMGKTPAIAFMADIAKETARELGFEINDQATGGASDANNVAQMGVPVLDGLGPIGGLDHSPAEYIELESIVPRTALLAGLIQKLLTRRPELLALRR